MSDLPTIGLPETIHRTELTEALESLGFTSGRIVAVSFFHDYAYVHTREIGARRKGDGTAQVVIAAHQIPITDHPRLAGETTTQGE
jgi:hypothetical protein